MPKGDRTGPMGTGARSGRGAGYCNEFNMPGYANTVITGHGKMGMGPGRGGWGGAMAGGRGRRRRCFNAGRPDRMYSGGGSQPQPFNPDLEKASLIIRSQALQSELEAIGKRLDEIDSQGEAS